MTEMWTHNDQSWTQDTDLTGYDVQALDGSIGEIGESTAESGSARIVVETGFWIFGKKRMIPAGAITRVDHDDRVVHVNLTKEQVKEAPDFEADRWGDQEYHDQHDSYYADFRWTA